MAVAYDTNFNNVVFDYTTWGGAISYKFNNCEFNHDSNKALFNMSAGKVKLIRLENCTINTTLNKVFNFFEQSYSIPNTTIEIINCTFNGENLKYIVDGVKITQGTVSITSKSNKFDCDYINPTYIDNQFVKLK